MTTARILIVEDECIIAANLQRRITRLGYEVVVIEDACRGIGVPLGNGHTTMDAARERLLGLGVRIVTSADLGA